MRGKFKLTALFMGASLLLEL